MKVFNLIAGTDMAADILDEQTLNDVEMDKLIEAVHKQLNLHPTAKVFMIHRASTESSNPKPRVHELDENFRNLIRDDLEKAKKKFEPIVIHKGRSDR